jgi:hypothetical protein
MLTDIILEVSLAALGRYLFIFNGI